MIAKQRHKYFGDDTHLLPAGMIEPYRLWFEFLKLALDDKKLQVDKKFYAKWSDVKNADFRKWWDAHWKELFGVPLDVIEVKTNDVSEHISKGRLVVSIQPAAPIQQTLKQMKILMKARGARAGHKDAKNKRRGQFAISAGAEIKRKNMQQALKVYELSFKYGDDRVKIASAYLDWAKAWNEKVVSRGWKRDKILVPPYLDTFLKQQTGQPWDTGVYHGGNSPESNRKKVARLIARAHKIAANVARGEFPGKY